MNSLYSNNENNIDIIQYDKDSNYFLVNQNQKNYVLTYDSYSNTYNINENTIQAVAQILAEQTIKISELREQIKTQMQKTYIKIIVIQQGRRLKQDLVM